MDEDLLEELHDDSLSLLESNSSDPLLSSPPKSVPVESISPKLKTKSRLGQSSVSSSISIENNINTVANIKIRYITDEVLNRYLTRQLSKQPQPANSNKKLTSSTLSYSGFHSNQTIEQQFTELDLTPEFKNEKFQVLIFLNFFVALVTNAK